MELAMLTCAKAETCHDNMDWNTCLYSLFEQTCIHIDEVGPGYNDCYKSIAGMQCFGEPDESCAKAFVRKEKIKEKK